MVNRAPQTQRTQTHRISQTQRVVVQRRRPSRFRTGLRRLTLLFVLAWVGVALYHHFKPLPPGTHLAGEHRAIDGRQVELLYDLTYRDQTGATVREQRIFDRLLRLINEAETFLVLDIFLFNDFAGDASLGYRPLSVELEEALVQRKRRSPELPILFITDPINDVYGGKPGANLARLEANGIEVVRTDLDLLRDSNPVYSGLWRMLFSWAGNRQSVGWLPDPFRAGEEINLRSWLRLLNFKANHRKVAIAGIVGAPPKAMVTSFNPHDASSDHSNVAAVFDGPAAYDLLESELAVARFSGWGDALPEATPGVQAEAKGTWIRVLTEGGIRDSLLKAINDTQPGDQIDVALFYLSHRGVIKALTAAARRDVQIRLVLDQNRDAFGRAKNGIPNRPVAYELERNGGRRVEVRWYQTEGEQFHSKLVIVRSQNRVLVQLGSCNLTRRNLDDYNMEANVELVVPFGSDLDRQVTAYFERIWGNTDGLFTAAGPGLADSSRLNALLYRVEELTGFSTF